MGATNLPPNEDDEVVLLDLDDAAAAAGGGRATAAGDEPRTETAQQRALTRLAGKVARVAGWSVDLRTNEVRWSPELYELLAWTKDRPPTLDEGLAMYREPEVVLVALARCAADGQPFDIEVEVTLPESPVRFARVVGEAQRGDDGRIAWLAGAFQDITRRRAREAETEHLHERFTQLLDATADGVVVLDAEDVITYVNPSALAVTARADSEAVVGRRLWDDFPDAEGGPVYRAMADTRVTGVPSSLEAYYYPPLASWFDISVVPSGDGVALVFRDVRDRVQEVQRLSRLAQDQRAVAEQLRELDRLKNAFLSAVSHELRTPLTIVQGMAETLQRLRGRLSDEQRITVEDAIVGQSRRLGRLLAELLDVDRLARGELTATRSTTDVAGLVRELTSEVADGAFEVHLDVPERLELDVDAALVERIVVNLVQNARKYAGGGRLQVRVSGLEPSGCRLEVRDDGPGIPEHELDAVFEPLYRRTDDDPKPGTGVGLALVRAFAELHGGTAVALPSRGGAHVQVDLPGPPPSEQR
jgi:signal transduction histidine kinase